MILIKMGEPGPDRLFLEGCKEMQEAGSLHSFPHPRLFKKSFFLNFKFEVKIFNILILLLNFHLKFEI